MILVRDCFEKEVNRSIMNEAIMLKSKFGPAMVRTGNVDHVNEGYRNNTNISYDDEFQKDRSKSTLLKFLHQLFQDPKIATPLNSAPYPLNRFALTNHDITQVSRYGDEGQRYGWHIDRFANDERVITFVYYFFKEPKQFEGGQLEITSSPHDENGELLDKSAKVHKIDVQNNMGIFFPSTVSHRVLNTMSPKAFEKGRFGANVWIGFK